VQHRGRLGRLSWPTSTAGQVDCVRSSSAVVSTTVVVPQRRQLFDLLIPNAPNLVNGHKHPVRLVRIEWVRGSIPLKLHRV
jgi:hypothetical protein